MVSRALPAFAAFQQRLFFATLNQQIAVFAPELPGRQAH
jgi:hypothetical protein